MFPTTEICVLSYKTNKATNYTENLIRSGKKVGRRPKVVNNTMLPIPRRFSSNVNNTGIYKFLFSHTHSTKNCNHKLKKKKCKWWKRRSCGP